MPAGTQEEFRNILEDNTEAKKNQDRKSQRRKTFEKPVGPCKSSRREQKGTSRVLM